MEPLASQKCIPCEGGIPPFTPAQIDQYKPQLKLDWEIVDGKKLRREFKFENFKEAIAFVNKVADLAEGQGHHPDISIYYSKVIIELWTHKIGGLFVNDFILAAKIEQLI